MNQKWPEPRTGKSASTLGTLLSGVCYGSSSSLNLHPSTMLRTGSTPFCPLPSSLPSCLPPAFPVSLPSCLPSFLLSLPPSLPSFLRFLELTSGLVYFSSLYVLILCYSLLTLWNLHLPIFLFFVFTMFLTWSKFCLTLGILGAVSYPFSCPGGLFFFFQEDF